MEIQSLSPVEHWQRLWKAADPDWENDPPEVHDLRPAPCDYLPDRWWSLKMIRHPRVDRLMLLGGQRFGYAYCVTNCLGCQACQPARIRVADFAFSKSQRRTIRRNADLAISVAPVSFSQQKYDLLYNFIKPKFNSRTDHVETHDDRVQYYLSFHLHHPHYTREVHYREGRRLLGVSIVDVGQRGLYSHYFFYSLTDSARRLGIFSFLQEIHWCQRLGLPHLYIGFLNEQTKALSYKSQFACLEVLRPEVGWSPYRLS